MPLDDPSSWATGLTALKTAFDAARSAITMTKDIRSLGGGTEQQQKAIDTALTIASSNTAIAEAEIAKALGYELCKCEFPPTPMKTVGYTRDRQVVYQCPKCGFNNAMGRTFTKTTGGL
jgi:hypothetical protein